MSERQIQDSLQDMLEAARRILLYIESINFEQFRRDYKTQDAVLRNLEVLGEAAKNISADFRDKHPDLPWTDMARTRDRLIHHYFGVNLDVVWGIAELELPDVVTKLEEIIEEG
jgi:uncharacterized protein with HEPN domain